MASFVDQRWETVRGSKSKQPGSAGYRGACRPCGVEPAPHRGRDAVTRQAQYREATTARLWFRVGHQNSSQPLERPSWPVSYVRQLRVPGRWAHRSPLTVQLTDMSPPSWLSVELGLLGSGHSEAATLKVQSTPTCKTLESTYSCRW